MDTGGPANQETTALGGAGRRGRGRGGRGLVALQLLQPVERTVVNYMYNNY